MKKAYLFLVMVLCMILSASADKKSYAQATFVQTEYDFGYIKESGGTVQCEFEFTNTGNKPLMIIDATASCGCTKPEYPKRPIAPGKSSKIKVTYNPLGRPGAFKKDIKITTNGKNGKITLYIIGSALPDDKK